MSHPWGEQKEYFQWSLFLVLSNRVMTWLWAATVCVVRRTGGKNHTSLRALASPPVGPSQLGFAHVLLAAAGACAPLPPCTPEREACSPSSVLRSGRNPSHQRPHCTCSAWLLSQTRSQRRASTR